MVFFTLEGKVLIEWDWLMPRADNDFNNREVAATECITMTDIYRQNQGLQEFVWHKMVAIMNEENEHRAAETETYHNFHFAFSSLALWRNCADFKQKEENNVRRMSNL
jgi:hypothetical protein